MKVLTPDTTVSEGPDRMLSKHHLSIVRLVLPKGKTIKRHRSMMTVTVVAIKGSIQFHTTMRSPHWFRERQLSCNPVNSIGWKHLMKPAKSWLSMGYSHSDVI